MIENKKGLTIGLITARGGSIRLPRKNILPFLNHPLVAWSIMQSRCSKNIDLTVLTTDDKAIAEVGRRYGAKVIMRPVMDDDVTAGVPFRMAVEELEKEGYDIAEIVCMLPTSPVKKVDDIDNLVSYFHMIRQYSDIQQMDTFCPDREMFVFRNVENMTMEYGKPYHVTREIADKNWHFSKLGGGWGIGTREYFNKAWNVGTDFDSDIDKNLDGIMFNGQKEINAYSIEPWQCFETDYECYFRICENLMEEFVLKGQGMKVYTDYARTFRKIVTWEEETKQLDLSQYIGNSSQLGE